MGIFGYEEIGSVSALWVDYIVGIRFKCPDSGAKPQSISVYTRGFGSAETGKCAIYNIETGSNLVAETVEGVNNQTPAWQTWNISGTAPILDNVDYVICYWGDDSRLLYHNGTSSVAKYKAGVYGAWPETIDPWNSQSRIYSLYVTYIGNVSKTITSDAVIGIHNKIITSSARIKEINNKIITSDAEIGGYKYTTTITSDATIKAPVSKTITSDAIMGSIFGNTATSISTIERIPDNDKGAALYVLTESGTVAEVHAYLKGYGADAYSRAGIYSDSSGSPDALLCYQAGSVKILSSDEKWFTHNIDSGGSVLAPGSYWLTIQADCMVSFYRIYIGQSASSGGIWVESDDTFSDGLADPFGATIGETDDKECIFVVYKPSAEQIVSQTIASDSRIKIVSTKTFTSDSRVKKINSNEITSDARILARNSQIIISDTRIKKTTSNTLTSDTRIRKFSSTTITSEARVGLIGIKTLTSDAVIKRTSEQTLTSDATLSKNISQTITSNGRIKETISQSVTSNARIKKTISQVSISDSRIKEISIKTITSDTRIKEINSFTLNSDASIKKISIKTILSDSRVIKIPSKITNSDSRIKIQSFKIITSNAHIGKVFSQTILSDTTIKGLAIKILLSDAKIYIIVHPPARYRVRTPSSRFENVRIIKLRDRD